MASSRSSKRRGNKRWEPEQLATPRRSQRLSEKYGAYGTNGSYPLQVSTRASLNSYKEAATSVLLNESGQSVPSTFDTDLSLDTTVESSIQHDHTYSSAHHMHGRDYVLSSDAPLSSSSPAPHLYGLDVSDDENHFEAGGGTDQGGSREFNWHFKERTLTPRKQTVPPGPSFIYKILSLIIRFLYYIGSFFYLLANGFFCMDVSLLHKLGKLCRGPRNQRPFCGFWIVCGIFFIVAICLVFPYIEIPDRPPPPPPPPPPPTPTPPSPTNDYHLIFRLIEELRADLERNKWETSNLRQTINEIDIDKALIIQLKDINDTINSILVDERNKTEEIAHLKKSLSELKDSLASLEVSLDQKINVRTKLLEERLMNEISKKPSLSEAQVHEIAQSLVDASRMKIESLLGDQSEVTKNLTQELIMIKNKYVLMNSSNQAEIKLAQLEATLNTLSDASDKIASKLIDLSNEMTAGRASDLKRHQQIASEIQELSNVYKALNKSLENLKKKISSQPSYPSTCNGSCDGVSEEFVWNAIGAALFNYSADQIARFDFALERSGGEIVDGSPTYDPSGSRAQFFGVTLPISVSRASPADVIRPPVLPGDCWCFKGMKGFITIKLAGVVVVDAVTIQHIPKILSPDSTLKSAPNQFKVLGILPGQSTDSIGTLLGTFKYKIDSTPIQTFTINNKEKMAFERITFQFESNYGNPAFTCIYRVRVHGSLFKKQQL